MYSKKCLSILTLYILLYILYTMFVKKVREKFSVFKYLVLWLRCKMTVLRLIYERVE
jgi:hypothetical protein